jgi:hypothetical protein
MKKLFALALIAGSLSFFACNNEGADTTHDGEDTAKVENHTTIDNSTNTNMNDSANMNNNTGDTAKTGTDTSATKKM